MSYDLYFHCKNEQSLSREEFINYFRNRPWYTVEQNQAFYENEDTGVYFCFEYQEENSTGDEGIEEEQNFQVSFNINYNRPHIFGLEAEPEIKNFVEEFKLNIFDPQTNGMGEGPYSTEGFLRGWNEGNLFGISAMISHGGENWLVDVGTLSHLDIERYWKWNLFRKELQDKLGDDIYVPRIMFCKNQNQIKSFIVWGDAIPIVLPKVDLVVLVKDKLASFRFFFKKPVISPVDYHEVEDLFPPEEMYSEQGLSYKILEYYRPPQTIREFYMKQQPGNIQGISVDRILDDELVVKAKKSASSMETLIFEDQPEEDEL